MINRQLLCNNQSYFLFILQLFSWSILVVESMKLQFQNNPSCLVDKKDTDILPPPIRSNVPGSWAFDTMSRRILEEIFPRIISENSEYLQSHEDVAASLSSLRESLQTGRDSYLEDINDCGEDALYWNSLLKWLETNELELGNNSVDSRNWLDAPWFISEAYFYRRVCSCFRYFETNYDYFAHQKCKGLVKSFADSDTLAATLLLALKQGCVYLNDSGNMKRAIEVACLASLWGNMMDLSLWPVSTASNSTTTALLETDKLLNQTSEQYLLNNHLPALLTHLQSVLLDRNQKKTVEIWVDNAGYELITDLFLAETLLSIANGDISDDNSSLVIIFRCKKYPTFVSDVTVADIHRTIEIVLEQTEEVHPSLYEMAVRLSHRLYKSKQILLEESFFLCQGDACWDMPQSHYSYRIESNQSNGDSVNAVNILDTIDVNLHRDELREVDGPSLVIVKGDANYRRLLGDRQWPFHSSVVNEVLSYWPVPVLALRTCKAETAIGLSEVTMVDDDNDSVANDHCNSNSIHNRRYLFRGNLLPQNWLVSGRYALIQFYQPSK